MFPQSYISLLNLQQVAYVKACLFALDYIGYHGQTGSTEGLLKRRCVNDMKLKGEGYKFATEMRH